MNEVGEITTQVLSADQVSVLLLILFFVVVADVLKSWLLSGAVNNLRKTVDAGLSGQRTDIKDTDQGVRKLAETIADVNKKMLEAVASFGSQIMEKVEAGFSKTHSRLGAFGEQMAAHDRDAAQRAVRIEGKVREGVDEVSGLVIGQAAVLADRVATSLDTATGQLRQALADEIATIHLRHDQSDERHTALLTLCETAAGILNEVAEQMREHRAESARSAQVEMAQQTIDGINRRLDDVQTTIDRVGAAGALGGGGGPVGIAAGGDGAGVGGDGRTGFLDEHADGGGAGADGRSAAGGGDDAKPGG